MKKYFILGILSWIFVFSGIFKWLGIPSFDQFLFMMLGERDALGTICALVICITLVYTLEKLPGLIKKETH